MCILCFRCNGIVTYTSNSRPPPSKSVNNLYIKQKNQHVQDNYVNKTSYYKLNSSINNSDGETYYSLNGYQTTIKSEPSDISLGNNSVSHSIIGELIQLCLYLDLII